jgi:hypothetical protein
MAMHHDRVRAIDAAFRDANDQLIASLQQLDDRTAAQRPAAGGWSAAQIGCHVALTNGFLSTVMGGGVAEMDVPKPDGFQETLATLQLPDKVQTFPALEPPGAASKADALAKLRASVDVLPRRCWR